MDIGMLWFDDSSRTFGEKVRRAAEYYNEKYGHQPTLCLVNPAALEAGTAAPAGIEVRPARLVMPHHFWIGVDEEAQQVQPPRRKAA